MNLWSKITNSFNQIKTSMSSKITVNGKVYSGTSVTIINGKVTIDGVPQDGEPLSGVVRIEVTGDLAQLKADANVVITGNVKGNVEASGTVQCGSVGGNVDACGSVQCDTVAGDVDAGGSVICGRVGGDVDAGGSVTHS